LETPFDAISLMWTRVWSGMRVAPSLKSREFFGDGGITQSAFERI
jgi:hypothetical protein